MLKIDNHILNRNIDVFESIKDKTLIYLDTKYWLILRDQNRYSDPNKRLLLDECIKLVDSNKCIFPISEVSFWEFFKQDDLTTLKETAIIVDRLSKGVSMINDNKRSIIESTHFFCEKSGRKYPNPQELVWTKLSFILGYDFIANLETEEEQQSFYDFVSTASLFEIVSILYKNKDIKPFVFKDNIKALNDGKAKYADENKSIKQMFLSELGGYLHLFNDTFKTVIHNMYCKENGLVPSETEKENIEADTKFKNLIYNSFRLGKLSKELPIYRIVPELFASARWNKERKYSDGNDTMDFLHASFALLYCDYFFTENELKTMIIQRKLDEIYDCQVESKQKIVLEKLKTLNNAL